MFKCLKAVPESSEAEIKAALCASSDNVGAAVQDLKISDLGKCPSSEWRFGFANNKAVCKVILRSTGWDLKEAKARARGVQALDQDRIGVTRKVQTTGSLKFTVYLLSSGLQQYSDCQLQWTPRLSPATVH